MLCDLRIAVSHRQYILLLSHESLSVICHQSVSQIFVRIKLKIIFRLLSFSIHRTHECGMSADGKVQCFCIRIFHLPDDL